MYSIVILHIEYLIALDEEKARDKHVNLCHCTCARAWWVTSVIIVARCLRFHQATTSTLLLIPSVDPYPQR